MSARVEQCTSCYMRAHQSTLKATRRHKSTILWWNVGKLQLHTVTYTKSQTHITGSQGWAMAKSFQLSWNNPFCSLRCFMALQFIISKPPSCSNYLQLVSRRHHQKATPIIIQCSHWWSFKHARKHQLWSLWQYLWKFRNNCDEGYSKNIWVLENSNYSLLPSVFLTQHSAWHQGTNQNLFLKWMTKYLLTPLLFCLSSLLYLFLGLFPFFCSLRLSQPRRKPETMGNDQVVEHASRSKCN